ncbi:MAG: polyhydroxyalkanoate synthesis repressor PhaR [Gammaproteobacteria bacterium]|nr:polyhydroxyalkanoate synthesis repressor PhaR [Gammaproteobacteria bacterium]
MRVLKKYPNRRLYDTKNSVYVTLEDVRQMVLVNESIQVVDSKTGADLTRSVLLQIIAEQEGEGHEPLLTNRVLQQLIRFYGDSMQGVLSRYIEQSVMTFLQQQELYQRRMRDVLSASPVKLVQKFADQNLAFWRNLVQKEQKEHADEAGQAKAGGAGSEPGVDAPRPPPLGPDVFDAKQQSTAGPPDSQKNAEESVDNGEEGKFDKGA